MSATYIATEQRPDGLYSVHLQAGSFADAEALCAERGLTLEGILRVVVHGDAGIAARVMCALSAEEYQPGERQ